MNKSTLQQINERSTFGLEFIDDKYFKYVIANRTTGDIKGAAASRTTLLYSCEPEVWTEYELLTKHQYRKKWLESEKV